MTTGAVPQLARHSTNSIVPSPSAETSFSYTLNDSGEERHVGIPEQGGRELIAPDPLPPVNPMVGAVV